MPLRPILAFAALLCSPALAAATPAPPAPAPAPAPASSVRPVHVQIANRLAPDSAIPAQIDGLLKATLANMIDQDSNIGFLEEQYPGLVEALGSSMRPVLVKAAQLAMPGYRDELATFYARSLSIDESHAFLTFLDAPTSRAFFGSIAENIDYKAMAGDITAERAISAKSLQNDTAAATLKKVGEMSPKEKLEINAFFRAPLGIKLIGLVPQKRAIDVKWANYSPPGLEAEMETAVYNGMIDHITKTDPNVADLLRRELLPQEKGK